jgi:hypothetical protein
MTLDSQPSRCNTPWEEAHVLGCDRECMGPISGHLSQSKFIQSLGSDRLCQCSSQIMNGKPLSFYFYNLTSAGKCQTDLNLIGESVPNLMQLSLRSTSTLIEMPQSDLANTSRVRLKLLRSDGLARSLESGHGLTTFIHLCSSNSLNTQSKRFERDVFVVTKKNTLSNSSNRVRDPSPKKRQMRTSLRQIRLQFCGKYQHL